MGKAVNREELRRLHEAATKGQWEAMTAEYEAEDGIAWAQSADCQRDADHAEYISACYNALPALLDELEAAQEELRRLTQAIGDLRTGRDRAVKEAQRQDSVANGLRKERDALAADNARLRSVLVWLDRIGGLGLDVHARITEALAAAPAQSLAAHDAALLRKVAKKHAYRRNDGDWTIHPDSLADEADRIEKEARRG